MSGVEDIGADWETGRVVSVKETEFVGGIAFVVCTGLPYPNAGVTESLPGSEKM